MKCNFSPIGTLGLMFMVLSAILTFWGVSIVVPPVSKFIAAIWLGLPA